MRRGHVSSTREVVEQHHVSAGALAVLVAGLGGLDVVFPAIQAFRVMTAPLLLEVAVSVFGWALAAWSVQALERRRWALAAGLALLAVPHLALLPRLTVLADAGGPFGYAALPVLLGLPVAAVAAGAWATRAARWRLVIEVGLVAAALVELLADLPDVDEGALGVASALAAPAALLLVAVAVGSHGAAQRSGR